MNNDKDTSMMLDIFLDNIDDFPLAINYNNNNTKKIIKRFYNALHKIENTKKTNYTQKIVDINDTNTNMKDLLNSNFTPKPIKNEMDKIKNVMEFNVPNIQGIPIKIIFLLVPNIEPKMYLFYFHKICSWLQFIIPYSNSKMKSFKLILYLSDFKKKIPNNQTEILNNINCNTAVTYACAINGSCLIYRKEEWFKVMMHETMHAFCLDFSGLDYKDLRSKVKQTFPLKIDFEISEGYSEFWALILNSVFKTYYILETDKDVNSFDNFYHVFSSMIYLEITFSLFQCVKIMKFMNIDYEDLYSNKVIYKQKTNVFEYYIIKLLFLYNYNDFLKMCDENNTNCINFYKSKSMLNKIGNFIKEYHNKDNFLQSLNYMKEFFDKIKNNFLKNTLRMSMF